MEKVRQNKDKLILLQSLIMKNYCAFVVEPTLISAVVKGEKLQVLQYER